MPMDCLMWVSSGNMIFVIVLKVRVANLGGKGMVMLSLYVVHSQLSMQQLASRVMMLVLRLQTNEGFSKDGGSSGALSILSARRACQ